MTTINKANITHIQNMVRKGIFVKITPCVQTATPVDETYILKVGDIVEIPANIPQFLENMRNEAVATAKQVLAKLDQTECDLKLQTAMCERLRETNERLQDKLVQLESTDPEDMRAHCKQLDSRNDYLEAKYEEIVKQNVALENKLHEVELDLKKTLNDPDLEKIRLQSRLIEQDQIVTAYSFEVELLKNNLNEAKTTASENIIRVANLTHENALLQEQVDELNRSLTLSTRQITSIQADVMTAEHQIKQLMQDKAQLTASFTETNMKYHDLENTVKEWRSKYINTQKECDTSQIFIDALTGQKIALELRCNEQYEEIEHLTRRNDNMCEERDIAAQRVEQLQNENINQKLTIKILNKTLEEKHAKNVKLEDRVMELNIDIDAVKVANRTLNDENKRLQDMHDGFALSEFEKDKTIEQLRESYTEFTEKYETYEVDRAKWDADKTIYEMTIADLKQEIEVHENLSIVKTRKIDLLQEIVQRLETSNATLVSENYDLTRSIEEHKTFDAVTQSRHEQELDKLNKTIREQDQQITELCRNSNAIFMDKTAVEARYNKLCKTRDTRMAPLYRELNRLKYKLMVADTEQELLTGDLDEKRDQIDILKTNVRCVTYELFCAEHMIRTCEFDEPIEFDELLRVFRLWFKAKFDTEVPSEDTLRRELHEMFEDDMTKDDTIVNHFLLTDGVAKDNAVREIKKQEYHVFNKKLNNAILAFRAFMGQRMVYYESDDEIPNLSIPLFAIIDEFQKWYRDSYSEKIDLDKDDLKHLILAELDFDNNIYTRDEMVFVDNFELVDDKDKYILELRNKLNPVTFHKETDSTLFELEKRENDWTPEFPCSICGLQNCQTVHMSQKDDQLPNESPKLVREERVVDMSSTTMDAVVSKPVDTLTIPVYNGSELIGTVVVPTTASKALVDATVKSFESAPIPDELKKALPWTMPDPNEVFEFKIEAVPLNPLMSPYKFATVDEPHTYNGINELVDSVTAAIMKTDLESKPVVENQCQEIIIYGNDKNMQIDQNASINIDPLAESQREYIPANFDLTPEQIKAAIDARNEIIEASLSNNIPEYTYNKFKNRENLICTSLLTADRSNEQLKFATDTVMIPSVPVQNAVEVLEKQGLPVPENNSAAVLAAIVSQMEDVPEFKYDSDKLSVELNVDPETAKIALEIRSAEELMKTEEPPADETVIVEKPAESSQCIIS